MESEVEHESIISYNVPRIFHCNGREAKLDCDAFFVFLVHCNIIVNFDIFFWILFHFILFFCFFFI